MNLLINFADEKYEKARSYNTETGKKCGFDEVLEWRMKDFAENSHLISMMNDEKYKRGRGYWMWKSYIIKESLKKIQYGDYLCYSDSDIFFINSIDYLVEAMEKDNTDFFISSLPFIEEQWTKQEVFDAVIDGDKYRKSNQRWAGFVLMKRTEKVEKMIDEYYGLCQDISLINDALVKDNQKNFIENRHDQSVLSLLTKKYGYRAFRDPSEYGIHPILHKQVNPKVIFREEKNLLEGYPQIIVMHSSGVMNQNTKVLTFLRNKAPYPIYWFYYHVCLALKKL
jgi:hypothetical protein